MKSKRIAILQSNYIPWKGYFDMIAAVDEFILYDDMQYTRRDWRNRNQIKTPQGVQWLTVPVLVKGKYHQKIRETEIDGTDWAAAHWKALLQNYRRASHFPEIASWLKPLYLEQDFTHISQLNRRFIEAICNYLAIKTVITIKLTWFDYAGYPAYPQLWGEFTHGVTILDLLFNCGKDSPRYMRCVT